MTTNLDARLNTYSSAALNIFRIVFDFLYAVHGASKLFAWPVDTGAGAAQVGT